MGKAGDRELGAECRRSIWKIQSLKGAMEEIKRSEMPEESELAVQFIWGNKTQKNRIGNACLQQENTNFQAGESFRVSI